MTFKKYLSCIGPPELGCKLCFVCNIAIYWGTAELPDFGPCMMLSRTFQQDENGRELLRKAYADDHTVCYTFPTFFYSFEFSGVSVTDFSTLFLWGLLSGVLFQGGHGAVL